jgi:hypothetical protein
MGSMCKTGFRLPLARRNVAGHEGMSQQPELSAFFFLAGCRRLSTGKGDGDLGSACKKDVCE